MIRLAGGWSRFGARRTAAFLLLSVGLAGCGKRGDPLPPLSRTPQPVSGLKIAQRGAQLEISYTTPRLTTGGLRLPVHEVELWRAEGEGDFRKLANRQIEKVAPGETRVVVQPLPAPGTRVRVAVRPRVGRHVAPLSAPVTLMVVAPPEPPRELSASLSPVGVVLQWSGTIPSPPPSPAPSPSPVTSPSPAASPSPSPVASPASPSPGTSPSPLPSASPSPSPAPTPSPTPPPPPAPGFWIYRRDPNGDYGTALTPVPLTTARYEDTSASPGHPWCYLVRAVAATDPLIESSSSNEVCLDVRDVAPPAAPLGLAVLVHDAAVELSWSPSPEADLTFYRVYRSTGGAPPEKVADVPATETGFRDEKMAHASTHQYTVTAVDAAGNESPPSSVAEAIVP